MTKKLISWLCFMAVFIFIVQSCVHDEIYSSSDPSSKEYHSKSLWKEDEKYIKNVMKIYTEHEKDIKKSSGIPDWDYAMSMGKYDESFMVVPIIENSKVVNTLACARFDKKVYFRYENSESNKVFFQNIIYGKYTQYKTDPQNNTNKGTQKGMVCITKSISMWYPDNESNPNAGGYWETNYYTNCYNFLDYSGPGWEDNGGGGFEYGDGGGNGNGNESTNADNIISELQDYPCAQDLVQQLPTLQNDLATAMRQIFQNNENYNITFRPRSNMGNVDGITFTSHTNTGSFTAIISLNDQVLAHATKEYILATMYHEVIHAFLDYEKFTLGDDAFQLQYPGVIVGYDYTADGTIVNRYTYVEGHQQLMPFLTTLQNILSQYNPNLPQDVIVAMARTGIATTTQEQKQLNSNEKNTTLGNHKGTACP